MVMTEDVKAEKFLEIFTKAREFTETVIGENQRLRYRVAALETEQSGISRGELDKLREQVAQLLAENESIRRRYREVEQENKDFATRYVEVEQQNTNLANLYVASYQLHSTLEFREVVKTVEEIIINLVGAESFAILLRDEGTSELRSIAWEGADTMPGVDSIAVSIGEGVIGEAASTGESRYCGDPKTGALSIDEPLAALPLKIKDAIIGEIVIYKLLEHKDCFTALDYELFSLLAFHAATAIFSSKLYSQSARKLNTIQSFLDLLTT